jgi:small-conductance mechanosensitive channel
VDEPFTDMMEDMVRESSRIGRNMAVALIVVGLAIMTSRLLRGFFQRRAAFRELPILAQTLVFNVISVATGVIACTAILSLWGATWSAIAAGIGLSTLAIALGLQDVLKSVAGGVVIILERPFEIGDRIRIKDLTGEVVDVHVRHIVLRMDNGHVALAPNGLLFTEPFENFSRAGDFDYSVIVSGIASPAHEAKVRLNRILDGINGLHQTPEVLLQLDLRSAVPWPIRHAMPGAGQRTGHLQRAIISWNSATEETAIAEMVEKLQAEFPEAAISVRRR